MPEDCAGEGINASFDEEGYTQNGHDYLIWIKKWWPTPGGANKGSDYYYPPGSSGTKQGGFEIDLLKSETLPLSGTFPVMTLRTQSNPWGGYSIEPFKVDDVTAQAAMEMRDNQLHLILRRWKGSESLPEVGLGDPPWNSCGVLICGDRRNVLGAWQNPDKKDPFTYHIGLFSTVTGEKISEMDATSWPSSAQLCGNYLVCYFPTRVFVMDISKGKEVWTQPIKDLTYRGPYPPTAKSPMTKPKQPDEP
jgi:hypothetical protein